MTSFHYDNHPFIHPSIHLCIFYHTFMCCSGQSSNQCWANYWVLTPGYQTSY
jgi:hypothetical protein